MRLSHLSYSVQRIEKKVHEHLLKLIGVRDEFGSSGFDHNRDIGVGQLALSFEKRIHAMDDVDDGLRVTFHPFRTSVIEKSPHDAVDPLRLIANRLKDRRICAISLSPRHCHVHEPHNRPKGVPHLMSDPGGKRTRRGQARRAHHLISSVAEFPVGAVEGANVGSKRFAIRGDPLRHRIDDPCDLSERTIQSIIKTNGSVLLKAA